MNVVYWSFKEEALCAFQKKRSLAGLALGCLSAVGMGSILTEIQRHNVRTGVVSLEMSSDIVPGSRVDQHR